MITIYNKLKGQEVTFVDAKTAYEYIEQFRSHGLYLKNFDRLKEWGYSWKTERNDVMLLPHITHVTPYKGTSDGEFFPMNDELLEYHLDRFFEFLQVNNQPIKKKIEEIREYKFKRPQETQFNCFPEHIDPNNLEFESYALGDRFVKSPSKDLQFFDAVSFLSENTSLKTNRKRIQALGTVYKTKKNTIINLRTKVV